MEDLPYVTGYCGEFGILQQAGPCRIPVSGMCGSLQIFMYCCYHYLLLTISDTWKLFGNDKDHTWAARCSRRDALDCEVAAHLQLQVEAGSAATLQPTSPAYTCIWHPVRANTVTGPSNQPGNSVPGESVEPPTQMETELLTRLAYCSVLSQYDCLGFLETYTRCGNIFLGSFLGCHLTSCTHTKWRCLKICLLYSVSLVIIIISWQFYLQKVKHDIRNVMMLC